MSIVFPDNWDSVGQPVSLTEIDQRLKAVVNAIPCNNLAYSGGIDSSLLLYYLLANGKKVDTFTITCHQDHPDYEYSMKGVEYYRKMFGEGHIEGHWFVRPEGGEGDGLVRLFYQLLAGWCEAIIEGDGIDEYMGGYYEHQEIATEGCYFDILHRLQERHLRPLSKNSGSIKVYLPFLDEKLIALYSQIPLSEKVNHNGRKLLIVNMAQGKVHDDIINRKKYGFATKP